MGRRKSNFFLINLLSNINKSGKYKKYVYDLLNIIKSLNIDLNTIDRRKYINIYEKKRTD